MNHKNHTIGIIGYGKVGESLTFALHKLGFNVFIYTRTLPDKQVHSRYVLPTMKQLVEKAHIIFITVPDKNITATARNIAQAQKDLTNKIFFHTSGAKTSEELKMLKHQGAFTASFHPLQTFPQTINSLSAWKNVYCVLEGDKAAIKKGKFLCKKLHMNSFVLAAKKKIYYHSAAVLSSNFLVLLIQMSQELALLAGIDKKKYKSLFYPLIAQSLENILNNELGKALSGPLVRKDFNVIRTQISRIKKSNPDIAHLYQIFVKYYQNYQ